MRQHHAKSHRAAVILHVQRVAREAERFGEVIHDLGDVIERICEFFRVRPIAMSEGRLIGRDKMIPIARMIMDCVDEILSPGEKAARLQAHDLQNLRAVSLSTRAQLITESKSTHSTASCAPAPPGP